MAKLTVYFKNNVVLSYPLSFEVGKVNIGRDDSNDLVIDNPDFAAAHAVVMMRGNAAMIRQLNSDFPLVLNGKNIQEATLKEGDAITIGQHKIVYTDDDNVEQAAILTADRKTKENYLAHVANYQIISGVNIGKIFHLKISMTMIGEPGSGIVVISKRKDGHFASVLEHTGVITLNNEPLANNMVKLNHHDVLVVGGMTVQFFLR
ncbi:MAG: FHA domain-containing protein [Methylococcales bacterium]